MTRSTCAILILCAFQASLAAEQVQVTLEAQADRPAGAGPYQPAVLKVRNGLDRPIAAVSLRASDGGPTLLYPLTAAPTGQAALALSLPATSPEQTYTVGCYDGYDNGLEGHAPPRLLAQAEARIIWPLERVQTDRVINAQALAAFDERGCAWPAATRQESLIALAAALVLGGFAMFIPGRAARMLALLGVLAGEMGLLAWMAFHAAPPLTSARTMHVLGRDANGRVGQQSIVLLSVRRTAVARSDLPGAWCVYPDAVAMRADRTILRPREPRPAPGAARGSQTKPASGVPVEARLAPGELKVLVADSTKPQQGLPPPPALTIAPGAAEDKWVIQADLPVPACVFVVGDEFRPLAALAARTPLRLAAIAARPMRQLRDRPAEFGFDEQSLRLFTWWDRTQRQVDRAYLVWPVRSADGLRLYVVAGQGGAPPHFTS